MSAIGTTLLSVPSVVLMATTLNLQCMVGKDGVPVGDLQQQPKCNYENLHLPYRMPPRQGYYDGEFQGPTKSLTEKDLTLNSVTCAEA